MRIFNTHVFGLVESMVRSGYPMKTDIQPTQISLNGQYTAADKLRAEKLGHATAGSGHDCFLKGIIVQCDIEAPGYWWPQFQRYHFADIISSQSKMHRLSEMDFNKLYPLDVDEQTIHLCMRLQKEYKEGKIELEEFLGNVPMALELTAGIVTNYLQLKTIYAQRKTHKLKMWREVFCPWVESLPMAKELGVCG